MDISCPCSPQLKYSNCCQPLHEENRVAQTPEQLMRSRYSAFALGNTRYLLSTWHPSTRPSLNLADNPEWVKLQVLTSRSDGDRGFVHFRAFYRADGELHMLEEQSRFVREQGHWFYLDGQH